MTRMIWGANGEKRWETGVNQVALYPPSGVGVPWNGVVSIDEGVTGGEVEDMFFDGIKYRSWVQNEDFQGVLTAFSSPPEFAECDGRKLLAAGLFATHQPRKSFGICYKTLMGNDLLQDRLGYRLHLVYNIIASPSQRSNRTKSDQPELSQQQWQLNCKPPWYGTNATYRATAHFIVDSTLVDPAVMAELENNLYGTVSTNPQLPTQAQVITILEGV